MLQVKINEKNLNKDIRLLNQVSTYKYYCNFERDDIEVIIDNQIVPIIFKDPNVNKKDKIEYNLKVKYSFYWKFSKEGIHTVKIIFKKNYYNAIIYLKIVIKYIK